MTGFNAAVAELGDRVRSAAASIGERFSFDPFAELDRSADLSLGEPGLISPNGSCRLVKALDGWLAINLARQEDRDLMAAWLGCNVPVASWDVVEKQISAKSMEELLAQAKLLHLPVAGVAATVCDVGISGYVARSLIRHGGGRIDRRRLDAVRVFDMSALWAGPLCGAILARGGALVTKLESLGRPDSTAVSTPRLDRRLNGSKSRVNLDMREASDRQKLLEMVIGADLLITSARPHALARLGLRPTHLFQHNPMMIWIAITAHGWCGEDALRVGFGDDCAAAGGLVDWHGGEPRFIGDAIADPLTGMMAAVMAMEALDGGAGGLFFDIPLACTAAAVATTAGLR